MNTVYRVMFILFGSFLIMTSGSFPIKANPTIRPEVRALWVDAFHDGIKTPAQTDQLIQDALKANINTLIVQVRRRGDAYYNRSIEPRTEDPHLLKGFDVLEYLITKAHANHIEVHAWLNTLVAWNSTIPPKDPNHVWNLHGPLMTERNNWVSYYRTYNKTKASWSDTEYSSYYLDPGHPDVLDHTVEVYLNVIKNYEVDGIHLDYSRYAGLGWGYNPTSIARYNAQFGTTGKPAPDDPQWMQWRRDQTANLVRKIYLKAIALKPHIKVSSAVITWGDGPVTEKDWQNSRAYADVCQDWRGWLTEGIIDIVMPMNYFNEWNPKEKLWYDRWIEWEKDHQYGRQIIIGPGIFSQYIDHSIEQIRRAQAPSMLGNYAAGVALYAYAWSNIYSNDDFKESARSKNLPRQPHCYTPETNQWIFPLLAAEGDFMDPAIQSKIVTQPVFSVPAAIPDMPWKSSPTHGYLMGTVTRLKGKPYDHIKVAVDQVSAEGSDGGTHREAFTDGKGWFGLAGLPPGEYQVSITLPEFTNKIERNVLIKPGQVAEVNF